MGIFKKKTGEVRKLTKALINEQGEQTKLAKFLDKTATNLAVKAGVPLSVMDKLTDKFFSEAERVRMLNNPSQVTENAIPQKRIGSVTSIGQDSAFNPANQDLTQKLAYGVSGSNLGNFSGNSSIPLDTDNYASSGFDTSGLPSASAKQKDSSGGASVGLFVVLAGILIYFFTKKK